MSNLLAICDLLEREGFEQEAGPLHMRVEWSDLKKGISELGAEVEELKHLVRVHVEEPVPNDDPMQRIGETMADYLPEDQWNRFEPLLNGIRAKLINAAAAEAKLRAVGEFHIGAIPETSHYATGWNECRQRIHDELAALLEAMDGVA